MWRARTSVNEGGIYLGRTSWPNMDSRSMDGKGDWGGDQNPSEEAWPKYCTHNVYQHTDSQGDVSYQTEPKQREAELPSMGKVLLCTSPTAWPLYACIEVLHGQPQSLQYHRGPGHNSRDGQTCRQMLNRIFYKYTTYKNC